MIKEKRNNHEKIKPCESSSVEFLRQINGGYPEAINLQKRTRHNRICHISWGFSSHSHGGHNVIQAKARRAMEWHCHWHKQSLKKLLQQDGQSSVEYAVISAGFLCILAAISYLLQLIKDGILLDQLLAAASHLLINVPAPNIADIFKY